MTTVLRKVESIRIVVVGQGLRRVPPVLEYGGAGVGAGVLVPTLPQGPDRVVIIPAVTRTTVLRLSP